MYFMCVQSISGNTCGKFQVIKLFPNLGNGAAFIPDITETSIKPCPVNQIITRIIELLSATGPVG